MRSRFASATASILTAALLAGMSCAGAAWAQEDLEVAIKAAYLYKFAPFVNWPASSFETPASPLVICVVGADPFGAVLDRAIAGQTFESRPIAVRRMATVERNAGCHIGYLGGSAEQPVRDALRVLRGAPVLTVTEGGGPRGAMHLLIVDNKVRFAADSAMAAEGGLSISSKLLSLAATVKAR